MNWRKLHLMLATGLILAGDSLYAQQFQLNRNNWDFGSVAYWKNDTARFTIRNAQTACTRRKH